MRPTTYYLSHESGWLHVFDVAGDGTVTVSVLFRGEPMLYEVLPLAAARAEWLALRRAGCVQDGRVAARVAA